MATHSKSPEQLTPKQEAANENTSQARLRELAGVSTELARIVAKNPNADPDLLRELGSSSDDLIREGVASNPNTPTDLLWKLGEEFPEELLNNPVFALLMLENPNLLVDMPQTTLITLIKPHGVPDSFLELAATHQQKEVLLALLEKIANPNTYKNVKDTRSLKTSTPHPILSSFWLRMVTE